MAWQKARSSSAVKRDNEVVLFENLDRKDDSSPHSKGSARVNGREYWASGWKNVSREGGKKYLVIKLTPKDEDSYKPNDRRQETPPKLPPASDGDPF